MWFLIDANLPPALAHALVEKGHRAKHVEALGLRHSEDVEIWQYALDNDAILMTRDQDFSDRCHRTSPTPIVIWLRLGNCRNPALLNWLLPQLPVVIARIESGERLLEVR